MENNYYLAREMIARHEGLSLKPYRCTAGKLTIGYGRNLDDRGISKNEAHVMMMNDMYASIKDLQSIFGKKFNSFPAKKQAALIDMMFNLGKTRFSGFKNMIGAIERGDWQESAKQAQDSKWFSQVGDRGKEVYEILKEGA